MTLGTMAGVSVLLAIFLVLAGSGQAQDEATKKPTEPSVQKSAREALAKFDKEWKVADRRPAFSQKSASNGVERVVVR
jgi:hypothetical protein